MYAFISNMRPCSVRAKTTERFKQAIKEAFKSYYPSTERVSNDLYGVVYYFHKTHNQLDADNLSKPIWDALEGVLYEDHSIIKYRAAGIFDLRSSTGGRKFPYHPKVKEIRFFQKIGFLSGLDISALLH